MTKLSVVQHRGQSGLLIFEVTGEMDISTSDQLLSAIRRGIAAGDVTTMHVDLGGVTFMDSTGINALMAGHGWAFAKGVDFRIVNPHPAVANLLRMTGVLDVLSGGNWVGVRTRSRQTARHDRRTN